MLCPCYSAVFEEEAAKKVENPRRTNPGRGHGRGQTSRLSPNNGGWSHRNDEYRRQFQQPRYKTFKPLVSAPKDKWVKPINQKGQVTQSGKRSIPNLGRQAIRSRRRRRVIHMWLRPIKERTLWHALSRGIIKGRKKLKGRLREMSMVRQ